MTSAEDIKFANGTLPIGAGAWGVIYKASDERLGREVAVKFYDGASEREIEEIRRHVKPLIKINHPNVVKVWGMPDLIRPDSPGDGPQPAIVMEYLDGPTLASWLASGDRDKETCIQLCRQIISGLQAFHEVDHIHADLHSKNVMVCGGHAKIIDCAASQTTAVFTTRIRQDSIQFDIRSVLDLIRSIMDCCSDKDFSRRFYRYSFVPASTLHDLHNQFECVLSADDTKDEYANANIYANAFENTRNSTVQRDLVGRAIESQAKIFSTFKANFDKRFETFEEVSVELITALNDLSSSQAVLYSAAASVSDEENARIATRILRRIPSVPWPDSGETIKTHIPHAICYYVLHVSGAVAMSSRNIDFLKVLFETRLRIPHEKAATLFENNEIAGWPLSLGGNCKFSWKFLLESYSKYSAVRTFFVSDNDYRVSMCAFSLLVSFASFLRFNRETTDSRLRFPPMFPWTHSNHSVYILSGVLDLCDEFPESGRLVYKLAGLTSSNVEHDWLEFVKLVEAFLSHGTPVGFSIPRLLEESPWNAADL